MSPKTCEHVSLQHRPSLVGRSARHASQNRHASRHAHAAGHPVMRSVQPGESWVRCFAHDRLVG